MPAHRFLASGCWHQENPDAGFLGHRSSVQDNLECGGDFVGWGKVWRREHGALTVAWYRFRATFRRRWGGYLSIVLLIGLLCRRVRGATAAGRQTQVPDPVFL